MSPEEQYDLIIDAVRQGLADEAGGGHVAISNRMSEGKVRFIDDQGRTVKDVPAPTFFKKVTSVREKLRVMEQKINNNKSLSAAERAELQTYLTRAYGSLTTFNFLFRDDSDHFKGSSG